MKNTDIRQAAKNAGVKLWQIAEGMGVCCSWFSVMLRKELSDKQKEKVFNIIRELSNIQEVY